MAEGWKQGGDGNRRGVLAEGGARHNWLNRVISHDGEENGKICVELGYKLQRTE